MEKKPLLDIVRDVEDLLVKENLDAREILMVLREVESNATLALIVSHLIQSKEEEKPQLNSTTI